MATGTLFTEDFLAEGITGSAAWQDFQDDEVQDALDRIRTIFEAVPNPTSLNEAQTQHRIIEPIFSVLGWAGALDVQTNLERRGRAHVPDYSFYATPDAFAASQSADGFDGRLQHAVAIGDAKAWAIGLDQSGGGAGSGETPSSQLIRYLTRAETISNRAVRWGILTNGRQWRLYYSGARSLLDGFFEIDLAWLVGASGTQGALSAQAEETDTDRRSRLFRTFLLFFRRAAFVPSARIGNQLFPEFAFNEGRLWEAKVRTDLSRVVFDQVFPGFIRGIVATDANRPTPLTATYLNRVRDAALTMLYRLLFALYAEDRELLPTRDGRFDNYALSTIRDDVAHRVDMSDAMTNRSTRYWDHCLTLFRIVDEGDADLGIPPYNGGLFARERAPLAEDVRVGDAIFAPLLDMLSRTTKDGRKVRINFRDLSVRELGAIYEGLLEYEPVADDAAQQGIAVRPNPFSRKTSGSYYTPDELVSLIIERTVGPLVEERFAAFASAAERLATDSRSSPARLGELVALDPASAILELKVCDPAMGSGHFLVSLIDYLSEAVFTATGRASAAVEWTTYQSPILQRLATIRDRIIAEATANAWTVRDEQLTDANLVKRMVLKRCVYGVDKNPMAVELAKVALWLHTFTTGAPLSFLDHHLKCGDSLFGERVGRALDDLSARGAVFINDDIRRAEAEVADMEVVENYTDAAVAEVHASAEAYAQVERGTAPLKRFLDFWQAIKWLDLSEAEQRALQALLDGRFGDPVAVAAGMVPPTRPAGAPENLRLALDDEPEQLALAGTGTVSVREWNTVSVLIDKAHALASEEHFLHWEVAFPGVWHAWQSATPEGGFDAIVGNPPWDRMKMQEVEWFAARDPAIARQQRAADRKAMVARLIENRTPLGASYALARSRAEKAMERARRSGEYPLLSRGDINIYSLFVERAQTLIHPTGISGLLTPPGLAFDLGASSFFRSVSSSGRLGSLIVFENEKGWLFSDIHWEERPTISVIGGERRRFDTVEACFHVVSMDELLATDRVLRIEVAAFASANPNTGTAPMFRWQRDAEIILGLYSRNEIVRPKNLGESASPLVGGVTFHLTSDSRKFLKRADLDGQAAYPVGHEIWRDSRNIFLPLLEGKAIEAFNHRYAHVSFSATNTSGQGNERPALSEDLANPDFRPTPRYWVRDNDVSFPSSGWSVVIRDTANVNNWRTCFASIVPRLGIANTLNHLDFNFYPNPSQAAARFISAANSFAFDYVARNKIQARHLNWYILEQLPIPRGEQYQRRFGPVSAAEMLQSLVLRLTYTAHDLAPFASDMGYDGAPFAWDEDERRHLRARLDALYFHLYGITEEADIRYILSTFPIVERKDRDAFGGAYLTAELIIWYFRALAAGDTESVAPVATLLRQAARAT